MVAATAIAVVIAAGAAIALMGDDKAPPAHEPDASSPGSESGLPQARWVVRTFAAGTAGPPRKQDRKAVAHEKEGLTRTVTSVVDSLTLATEPIDSLAGSHLTPAAAKALEGSRLPLPARLQDIQMVKRRAEIGLDANGANRAAALVTTVVKGTIDGSVIRLSGRSRFYLQKRNGNWQIVAFDAERAPRSRSKDEPAEKGADRSGSKKKGKGRR